MPAPEFHAWSTEHFAALGVIGVLAAAMIAAGRLQKRRATRAMEIALALLLVAQWPVSYWVNASAGTLTPNNLYPCHFCDIAAMAGVIALLTHRQFFVELVYFWGLAGTLQGLITPSLTLNWPHPRFLLFFIAHGGVVIAALHCVCGLQLPPRPRAKWVAFLLLFPFAAIVGTFDWMVGANYGFLCHKPETASLYDVLGPWPWYVGASGLVGLVFFILLDLPFVIQRARVSRR
jgi:hypothetical integral membrane protein (TIGR02206 family)